jgi:hypothetical protein
MASESEKRLGDMLDYLPAEEGIIGRHNVGSYEIVTTTERLICLRKFPPLFVEVHYADINNLEHRTTILWSELLNGLSLLALSAVILYYNMSGKLFDPVNNIIRKYLPELSSAVSVEILISVLVWLAAAAGLYHLMRFAPSVRGYFRISRRDRAPVVIPTGMTPELRALIKEIEGLMQKKPEYARPQEAPSSLGQDTVAAGNDEIREKLLAQLVDVTDNRVILISSKSENHSRVVSNMLDILVNQRGMGGVYLSITRPYEFILSTTKAAGIPAEDIYFIDCISLMAGKQHEKNENVVFVENPSSLEEVSMYLDRMLSKVQKPKKFLFLDSLSSLLIYNTDKSVREFTHFIINKIRLENITGVILSIEKKEAEDLVKTLTPMCDAEVRF